VEASLGGVDDLPVIRVQECRHRDGLIGRRSAGALAATEVPVPEIDESGDEDAVVIACIQELDEFIARKLRRYPTGAIAVAAGMQLEGLLGALFDERQCTADEVRELLREIESGVLDPQRQA
jgi:hypothetical protein